MRVRWLTSLHAHIRELILCEQLTVNLNFVKRAQVELWFSMGLCGISAPITHSLTCLDMDKYHLLLLLNRLAVFPSLI